MIIIPDIHGRSFWRSAVQGREEGEIIFLGDYLDPYEHEKTWEVNEAWHNLESIVEFKKLHPKNVTLLIGNHDWHYMGGEKGSRYDYMSAPKYSKFFKENKDLFQLAYEKEINGKRFIFSHSCLLKEWLKEHTLTMPGWTEENIVDYLNNGFSVKDGHLLSCLDDVSFYRGGWKDNGSVLWADVHEVMKNIDKFNNAYLIFGHTQLNKHPIITDYFACLDIRRAFELKEDGVIYEINGEPAIKFDELNLK